MKKAEPENNYHYNKKLLPLAKANRNNMTKSAACLWKYVLSQKQMMGYPFRRERPILNYIADFVCLELYLIIEVDGWTHLDGVLMENDAKRDKALSDVGFTTLRFSSEEVLNNIREVSLQIEHWIEVNSNIKSRGYRKRRHNM